MQDRQLIRADLVTGLILVAFGLAVLMEAVGMPRFETRRINPWTVPGLVPGFLAIIIAVLGAALALRSTFSAALRAPAPALDPQEAADVRAARRRLLACLGICLAYAAGLVGRVPFWLATGFFVFAFVAAFEWQRDDPPPARARKLAIAAVLAAAAAILVPLLFERLFLVRLP
ncbi:tripartite tricarboxylate transporter TctB family protein [Mesorhizobium sp. WSM2239]|uniref:Tripartite tricarboxylate transporter TctB family protein n=2 Tax=unclassified Mesorhizobium TaxID=325217 RepID=A0AAU8D755_9HYPH